MQNVRHLIYANSDLIFDDDTRLVSVCADRKIPEIRARAAEVIAATGVDWMAAREVSGGKAVPQSVRDQCAEYRARSNDLEARVAAAMRGAIDDDDKAACDAIETIVWPS